MKTISLFTLLVCFSLAHAQSSKDLIRWQVNKKLTWNDFKASVDPQSSNAALTNTSIKIDMGYGSHGFTYKVNCFFDKTKSWVKVKTDYILTHEQHHFDIAELYARKLNKAMKNYKYNEATVNKDINNIYSAIMKEHAEVQNLYDNETNYSRNKEGQEKWNKKITDELKEYEAYAGY